MVTTLHAGLILKKTASLARNSRYNYTEAGVFGKEVLIKIPHLV